MDLFLTDNKKAIPKLIALDANSKEIAFTWGPRPQPAVEMVRKQINATGSLTSDFKAELQKWYNTDKGAKIVTEILDLLGILKPA